MGEEFLLGSAFGKQSSKAAFLLFKLDFAHTYGEGERNNGVLYYKVKRMKNFTFNVY